MLIGTEGYPAYKSSYIDLDDSGLDKVSFITSTKAAEVIADFKKMDKEEDIVFSPRVFNDVKYNNELNNQIYSKLRSVTTIGRLINKLYPKQFEVSGNPGEDIQSFVDKFKSARDTKDLELVTGKDIVKYYDQKRYIDKDDTEGSLGQSCMQYDYCAGYIQFYTDNDHAVSLLILRDEEKPKRIRGRALVWELAFPSGRTFMDRIYTVDSYDEELFKSYAKKNGWLYKYNQNHSDMGDIVDTIDDSRKVIRMVVKNIIESSTDKYPYMDTLKYFFVDSEILSNNEEHKSERYWTLEDTNGGYEEEETGMYVEYYGEYISDDELQYCDLGDDWRYSEDAVYLPFYGEHATEEYLHDNMKECDYCDDHNDAYRMPNDTVEVYGTNDIACEKYAENNMYFSDYYNSYLPQDKEVWSEHHETYLYGPEAEKVYTNESQTKTDWRAEDDDTWWEWKYDGENYDNDISEKELRSYNNLDKDEETEDQE